MRYLILFGLLGALALGLSRYTPQAYAQTPDAAAVDAAVKQAFLTGDLNAVLAQYAPDVVASELGQAATGRDALRALFVGFITANPGFSISFSDTVAVLDTAVHRAAISSDPIRAAGVSRIWVIETLVVFQGKVVSETVVPDVSDAETVRFLTATAGR